MTEEQKMIYELLVELDEICSNHNLNYFLSPRMTLSIYARHELPASPLQGVLFLPVHQMEQFRLAVEQDKREDRYLDSMYDNPRYPNFSFRYTNTQSLCYCLNKGRNLRYPGIGIDICPIRPVYDVKEKGFSYRYLMGLECGWKQTCDLHKEMFSFQDRLWKIWVMILSAFGKEAFGRKLYRKLCTCFSQEVHGETGIERPQWQYYQAGRFDGTARLALKDHSFLVPKDMEGYLTEHYGEEYKKKAKTSFETPLVWMISPRISCQEFFEQAGDLSRMIRARRRLNVRDEKTQKYRQSFLDGWEICKQAAEQRQ